MLHRACGRIAGEGWHNVRLREGDVCELEVEDVGGPFDAALCTLGLSVIPHWQRAWEAMTASVRPGGRLAIMDAGYPEDRAGAMLARPVAWALSGLFAADCSRRPWRLLQRDARDATTERFALGWVTAAAGTSAAA